MGRKRKGKRLALNQSHCKKIRRCANPINCNDNMSTIVYSDDKATSTESSTFLYEDNRSQFPADKELLDILDKLTRFLKK